VHTPGKLPGSSPEIVIESDLRSPTAEAVEQRSHFDDRAEHLLQAQRLRAELDLIARIGFGPPTLVFDGKGTPPPLAAR